MRSVVRVHLSPLYDGKSYKSYLENRILIKSYFLMNLYLKYESEKMKRHPKQANTQICEARMMKVIQQNEQTKPRSVYARIDRMVKLERAQGGCLGTKSRRKT